MWRPGTSSFWMRPIMLAVAPAALVRMAECADWVLDARGHYLRMPVHLLLPHLIRKAVRSKQDKDGPHRLLPLEKLGENRENPPF